MDNYKPYFKKPRPHLNTTRKDSFSTKTVSPGTALFVKSQTKTNSSGSSILTISWDKWIYNEGSKKWKWYKSLGQSTNKSLQICNKFEEI